MVRGTMREHSDVRETYLYTERDPSSSPSSFLLRRDCRSDLLSHYVHSLPSLFYLPYSHTLPPCEFVLLALPVADRPENTGPVHKRPDPLNLTWQVPAEWTRLGPRNGFSLLIPFVPIPSLFCLPDFLCLAYGQLISLSLSQMMAAIALACIMAHKKRSTSALNHLLLRITPRWRDLRILFFYLPSFLPPFFSLTNDGVRDGFALSAVSRNRV